MLLEWILEVILGMVMETVLEPLMIVAGWFLWWLVMFPIIWILCAPFILLRAVFYGPDFGGAVVNMFRSVHEYWRTHGFSNLNF